MSFPLDSTNDTFDVLATYGGPSAAQPVAPEAQAGIDYSRVDEDGNDAALVQGDDAPAEDVLTVAVADSTEVAAAEAPQNDAAPAAEIEDVPVADVDIELIAAADTGGVDTLAEPASDENPVVIIDEDPVPMISHGSTSTLAEPPEPQFYWGGVSQSLSPEPPSSEFGPIYGWVLARETMTTPEGEIIEAWCGTASPLFTPPPIDISHPGPHIYGNSVYFAQYPFAPMDPSTFEPHIEINETADAGVVPTPTYDDGGVVYYESTDQNVTPPEADFSLGA